MHVDFNCFSISCLFFASKEMVKHFAIKKRFLYNSIDDDFYSKEIIWLDLDLD